MPTAAAPPWGLACHPHGERVVLWAPWVGGSRARGGAAPRGGSPTPEILKSLAPDGAGPVLQPPRPALSSPAARNHGEALDRPGEATADQHPRHRGRGERGGAEEGLQPPPALHAGQGPQRGHPPATTSSPWRTRCATTWWGAGSARSSTTTTSVPRYPRRLSSLQTCPLLPKSRRATGHRSHLSRSAVPPALLCCAIRRPAGGESSGLPRP